MYNSQVAREVSLPPEVHQVLIDTRSIFRRRWAELIEQQQLEVEVAPFDTLTCHRHNKLWEKLIRALRTGQDEDYLQALKEEGRIQARASSRIDAVVRQTTELLNLLWEVLSYNKVLEQNPAFLKPLTYRINNLRVGAEKAILNGYLDEQRVIQEELALESAEAKRLRLEKTSLPELIKSLDCFRLSRYRKDQTIFEPGGKSSAVFFVMSGKVRLYELLPDGRAVTLSILSANDVFAQFSHETGYFHDIYAEAMRDSIIARIQETSFEALIEQTPLLASRIISSFSQQLSQSQLLIEGLLGRDVGMRLIVMLLKLANEFGVAHPNGAVGIDLELTHQELADMIGSNRVTITRKLLELQNKKLIEVSKGAITLNNRSALEKLVA